MSGLMAGALVGAAVGAAANVLMLACAVAPEIVTLARRRFSADRRPGTQIGRAHV